MSLIFILLDGRFHVRISGDASRYLEVGSLELKFMKHLCMLGHDDEVMWPGPEEWMKVGNGKDGCLL